MSENSDNIVELENGKRFSESLLCKYERDYFERKGVSAWALGEIPYYITCNALIAYNYANIVLRFIQDCLHNNTIQFDSPLYVFELGTGSGKFGYLFLQHMTWLLQHFRLDNLQFCYVMTDFTYSNLDYWQTNPSLQKFVQEGVLDFAIFDARNPGDMTLVNKKKTINASTNANPVIIVANYFFDSLNTDVLSVKDGKLEEGLVAIKTPQSNIIPNSVSMLEELQVSFSFHKTDLPYYHHETLDGILADYKQGLSEGTFCVPIDGVKVIEAFKKISHGKFLLITSDKGYVSLESMVGLGSPHIAYHGSFSLMVNYDFLGRYVKRLGGDVLFAEECEGMKTSMFCLGQKFADLPETSLANYQFNKLLSTKEFLELKNILVQDVSKLGLSELLSLMKFSHWDTDVFMNISSQLISLLDQAGTFYLRALRDGLKGINANYYYMKNNKKIPFELGRVYQIIKDWDLAIDFYKQHLNYFGEDSAAYFNMGSCYHRKNDLMSALKCFQKAKEMDDTNKEALKMIEAVEAEMRAVGSIS